MFPEPELSTKYQVQGTKYQVWSRILILKIFCTCLPAVGRKASIGATPSRYASGQALDKRVYLSRRIAGGGFLHAKTHHGGFFLFFTQRPTSAGRAQRPAPQNCGAQRNCGALGMTSGGQPRRIAGAFPTLQPAPQNYVSLPRRIA